MAMRSTGYLPNDWGLKNELIELCRLGRCFVFGAFQSSASSDYAQVALANTRTDGQPLVVYSVLQVSSNSSQGLQMWGFPSVQVFSTSVSIYNARLDGKASGATASTQAGTVALGAPGMLLSYIASNIYPVDVVAPGVIIVPAGWSLAWQFLTTAQNMMISPRWIEPVAELPIDGC